MWKSPVIKIILFRVDVPSNSVACDRIACC